MKRAIRVFLWVGIAALFLAPWAVAQNVTLTSAGSNVYDGIYVSPYYATVNGVANTPVVCDDFGDESYVNRSWSATVTPYSSSTLASGTSSTTSWGLAGGSSLQYDAVAWLTGQVLQSKAGSSSQIWNSFALWAVFEPSQVASYLSNTYTNGTLSTATLCTEIFGTAGCSGSWNLADASAEGGLLAAAYGAQIPSGGYNLEVLAPQVGSPTSAVCIAGKACPAQEFIAMVPEGGAALAYLFLAGLCCFGAIFMRSRRQMGSMRSA